MDRENPQLIDVHNDIFGRNSNCGVERVYYETSASIVKPKGSIL